MTGRQAKPKIVLKSTPGWPVALHEWGACRPSRIHPALPALAFMLSMQSSRRFGTCGRILFCGLDMERYGVNWLMNVDQLPSAARVPGALGEPAHVPSKLSPLPPAKNGPPQVV